MSFFETLVADPSKIIATTAAAALLLFLLGDSTYNLAFHPLAKVPGPVLARSSKLFLIVLCFIGIEGRTIRGWHHEYKTRVLRIAPNKVSISDPEFIKDIYITSGGFVKDDRYRNFDMGSIVSIFSAIDTSYRDVRAKAVAPLFATSRLRAAAKSDGAIGSAIVEFVRQLRELKSRGVKFDLLDIVARLSIDTVTGYLLGEKYGGLVEYTSSASIEDRQQEKLSANHFIFAIVGWARFSLLPKWLFTRVYPIYSKFRSPELVGKSFAMLDAYAQRVMDRISSDSSKVGPRHDPNDVYPGRLMQSGVPTSEAAAQAKAIIFAGTDSTSVMLTTCLFHLVQQPHVRTNILAEIRGSDPSTDPRTLPWLSASVKEGLRLGMANPVHLTREVPAGGMSVHGYMLPAGTIVGMAASILHYDTERFPDPFRFRPERWLGNGQDNGLRRPDMERSILSFGAGLRACIGKNLAQEQLYQTVRAVIESEVLDGAKTCKEKIELIEWFNGEIVGHVLEIDWR